MLSPLAAMVGGIGVILSSIGGAAVAVGCAFGWTALARSLGSRPGVPEEIIEMREVPGVFRLLPVHAMSPAPFEELAFRGLLQGRLLVLTAVP